MSVAPPSSPPSVDTAPSKALLVLAAVIGVLVGYVYLKLDTYALDLLWTTIPEAVDNKVIIAIYVIIMTTGGATVVGYIRRRTGVFGHSPLDGLLVKLDPLRVSLISLGVILITLLSGAVLGPEAGLLAIGTATGTILSQKANLGEGAHLKLIKAGALGAVLALVVALGFGHTIQITTGAAGPAWIDLVWPIPVAVAAALLAAVIRFGAYRFRAWADPKPIVIGRVALVGFLVGVCGIVGVAITNINPRLILGSGEGFILGVMEITSLSTLVVVLVIKAVAYSLCLGGGLRGGPIFPAMFLGAAVATVFTLLHAPGQPTALVASGVLAATTVGLAMSWRALIIFGMAFGLLLGSWLMIPTAIIGLAVGRLVGTGLNRVPGIGPVPDPGVHR